MIFNKLMGSIPAIITPLNENGTVNKALFQKMILKCIDSGCNGIMVAGSAGEGCVIPRAEYLKALETAVETVENKGIVVACISGLSYEDIQLNVKTAVSVGADTVLSVQPFYYPLNQEQIKDFFNKLADYSELPVMIYNMPQVTKVNIDSNTICALSNHENIVGVKDSSGNIAGFQQIIYHTRNCKFRTFIGRAPLIATALLLGASGTMTPIGNLHPEMEMMIYKAIQDDDMEKALAVQNKICEIVKLFNYEGYPVNANIKALLSCIEQQQVYSAAMVPQLTENQKKELYARYINI